MAPVRAKISYSLEELERLIFLQNRAEVVKYLLAFESSIGIHNNQNYDVLNEYMDSTLSFDIYFSLELLRLGS